MPILTNCTADSSNGLVLHLARTMCALSIANLIRPFKYACKCRPRYPYKEHSELKTGLHSAKPPSKGKDGVIQLLDYNLARFDFQDLKGSSYTFGGFRV